VTCDGVKVDDLAAGVRLKPGRHTCVGKKDGYLDKSDVLTVKLGPDVKVALPLKKKPDVIAPPAGGTPAVAPPKNQKCGTFINPCK
jgi:hypothetical protein